MSHQVRVVVDVETCGVLELPAVGAHVYAAHPDTQVTVLCYAIDHQIVRPWTGGPPPDDLAAAITAGATVVAHNYFFELCLWREKLLALGFPPIRLDQWSCTMARALVAGYPASLELACHAARLPIKKDKSARDLMLRFARPRNRNPLTWWHLTDRVRFAGLVSYCAQDVAAERALDQTVPELSAREHKIFLADHAINERGLRVDTDLVTRMHALGEEEKTRINARLTRLTNGQVTKGTQRDKIVTWLEGVGAAGGSLKRDVLEQRIEQGADKQAVLEVLQARLDVSRSSTAKLETILASAGPDGRMRGCFQYYGASRTGRFAGRRFQPQNLPRGVIKDVLMAVRLIQQDISPEDLELLFDGSVMGVLASCLRATLQAAPGHVLVAADLSQIEARILVWLAGQTDVLEVFARGDDVYTHTARRIGSGSRQLGKVLVLGAGFGAGWFTIQQVAASFGLVLTEQQARDAVDAWRGANPRVVEYWYGLYDTALRVAAALTGATLTYRNITFRRVPGALLLELPNGRPLIYRNPRIEPGEYRRDALTYWGAWQGTWSKQRSWPGKLTENVVQATARDVMAAGLIQAHAKGIPLIATIHDELVAEVPAARGEITRDWMLWAMKRPLGWAPGLPIAADAFVGTRYHKAA